MYSVSQDYKDAITARSRTIGWKGKITQTSGTVINITSEDISSGGISVTKELFNNDMPWVGATCSGQLEVTIVSNQPRMAFYNAKVEMTFILYFKKHKNQLIVKN